MKSILLFLCFISCSYCLEMTLVSRNSRTSLPTTSSEYKYFYSRGVLIVSFVVWLLIQAGFAVSATIFRKMTADEGWFVIDGVYPLLSTPIGIFVWILYGAICISLFGKTLYNLSRSSYDDIPEELINPVLGVGKSDPSGFDLGKIKYAVYKL